MLHPPCKGHRTALLAITRHGITLAGRITGLLPGSTLFAPQKFQPLAQQVAPQRHHCYAGPTAGQVPELLRNHDALVAVVSLGAMVRLLAPHLEDKERDPGVVVIDEAARFVIPMLSGHLGGANAMAGWLAGQLGAQAVLTTASDARQGLAVDLLGRELGWTLEATKQALVALSAASVNEQPLALVQECGSNDWWRGHANGREGEPPLHIERLESLEQVDPDHHQGLLWITNQPLSRLPEPLRARFADRLALYRPGAMP